jgi:glycerophosphoryl diester phosphodiesterase
VRPRGEKPYLQHDGPVAMAHRGFSREGLENSMAAFAAAVDLGYRFVETDVHATSDGVAVALHDASLDRVTDTSGAIAELPWRTVAGARILGQEPVPRLDELLGTWPELRWNIDAKSDPGVVPLVAAIERARAHDRVCIGSFSDRRRRQVLRRLSRPVATSAGTSTGAAFRIGAGVPGPSGRRLAATALRGIDALQVPISHRGVAVVTATTLASAHAAGVPVHVWTVNDRAQMEHLLDLGVDGLISDRADLLKEVLSARGQWV